MIGLIILAYTVGCGGPLIVSAIRRRCGKEISSREWNFGGIFLLAGWLVLSLGLYWTGVYAESLWFTNLGYESVFWKILSLKWISLLITAALVFAFIKANAWLAKSFFPAIHTEESPVEPRENVRSDYYGDRQTPAQREYSWRRGVVREKSAVEKWGVNIFSGLVAFIAGILMFSQWNKILLYLNGGSFNVADPIFGKDIGFYIFHLPFYGYIAGLLFVVFLVTFIALGFLYRYYDSKANDLELKTKGLKEKAICHCSLLLAGTIGFLIWQRFLGFYWYLFSESGVVFGAGYTDMFRMTMNKIFIAALIIVAIALVARIFWKEVFATRKRLIVATCFIPAVWLGCMVIVPALVQRVSVEPNEIRRESQYIAYNIDLTQQAFGLKDIEEKEISIETLTPESAQESQSTLENIRLWDWRALKETIQQIQAIRLYYEFQDIDIDRYIIDGKYRQVMLAAREIDQEKLPEQSWMNRRLVYTHGYGLALNAVNEFATNREPKLLVKDIPPESSVKEIQVTQPEVYYGGLTKGFVWTNTAVEEFDYPKGDDNIYSRYQGRGGVELKSFFRRLAFTVKFMDLGILFSGELMPDSRLMWHREIKERVETIAPFLAYDQDNYLVIRAGGNLAWIQDGYTISKQYPYSEPQRALPYEIGSGNTYYRKINYIRNSVKAAVDSYSGQVGFYIFDEADPIVQTYQKAFPKLFKARSEMPADLVSHVRYPENLFSVQASVYRVYHMENPKVFYNKEDAWEVAKEFYEQESDQEVTPYYVIIHLPDEPKEEFLLMLPYTPKEKHNMIAWIAGRCDGENYGKLLIYKFSKGRLIYGTSQIEAKINQNDEMTSKFTLWSKRADVIRGNTLVIPLQNSILYVEPVFLKSKAAKEEAKLPQLVKVIVATITVMEEEEDLKLVWDDTFEGALSKLVEEKAIPSVAIEPGLAPAAPTDIQQLIQSAQSHFVEYQRLTGEGRLVEAGKELKKLQEVLNRLYELSS